MSDVTQYLRDELRTAQRRLTIASVGMLVLVVGMIAYFQWIKSMTAELLVPSTIAEFVTNEVRRTMPEAAQSVSASLVEAAPDVVRYAMQQVVDEVLPAMTDMVEGQLNELSREAAHVGSGGVNAAFASSVTTCQAGLAKQKVGSPDAAADAMAMCLEKTLPGALDDKVEEILGGRLEESVAMLRQIDGKLKSMAASKNPSREDELGKQVVTAWWTFLEKNHPAVIDPEP